MATFVLDAHLNPPRRNKESYGLGIPTLRRSAEWYTHVRWLAAAIFAAAGLLMLIPMRLEESIGVVRDTRQMWILAGLLSAGNLPFWMAVRRLSIDPPRTVVKRLLWGQIALDLAAVTLLVHSVGSTLSFVAFFYLLHITLSCISLSRNESLIVAVASAVLYVGTVLLELTGAWPAGGTVDGISTPTAASALFRAASAVFLWLVIWYFISTLSLSLRRAEGRLRETNVELTKANEEKNRIMIQTTHDLKSPFFGIETNLALLRERWWNDLPVPTHRLLDRISALSKSLRARIDAILLYNEMRSGTQHETAENQISSLPNVMSAALSEVSDRAAERGITLLSSIPNISVHGNERQLAVLFANLLANAVTYSHPKQSVTVTASSDGTEAEVSIRDSGIGIRESALPLIFDEYYRTKEAANLNHSSTGLGLAIVKEIAEHLALTISVESEEGTGTTFSVRMKQIRSTQDAEDHDC